MELFPRQLKRACKVMKYLDNFKSFMRQAQRNVLRKEYTLKQKTKGGDCFKNTKFSKQASRNKVNSKEVMKYS